MRPFTMTPGGAYWSRRRLSVRRTRSRAAGVRGSAIGGMSGMTSRAGASWRSALDRGPGEDLVLLVDQPKEIRPVGDVLRVTEQEKPGLVQREVERGKHPLLQLLAEVDEDVAAAHEVKLREGRIGSRDRASRTRTVRARTC